MKILLNVDILQKKIYGDLLITRDLYLFYSFLEIKELQKLLQTVGAAAVYIQIYRPVFFPYETAKQQAVFRTAAVVVSVDCGLTLNRQLLSHAHIVATGTM